MAAHAEAGVAMDTTLDVVIEAANIFEAVDSAAVRETSKEGKNNNHNNIKRPHNNSRRQLLRPMMNYRL